jgi:hypothetical protein
MFVFGLAMAAIRLGFEVTAVEKMHLTSIGPDQMPTL